MTTLRILLWIATQHPVPFLLAFLSFAAVVWYAFPLVLMLFIVAICIYVILATWKMEMADKRKRPPKVNYAFLRTPVNFTQMPMSEIRRCARARRQSA